MRVATVFVALLVAGASLTIALWITRSDALPVSKPVVVKPPADPLPISPTGPWPIARVDNSELKFGIMELGEERDHEFKIFNDGQAPLLLKQGATTCQCTLSELAKKEIAPGDSASVKLTWKPTAVTEVFEKGATIYTNDPKSKDVMLKLTGRVVKRLVVSPDATWTAPLSGESKSAAVQGMIYSETVEKFNLVSVASSNPLMTAQSRPMTGPELEKIRAKSGYYVDVKVQPNKTAGPFAYELLLRTDVPVRLDSKTFSKETMVEKVTVTGSRRSSIHLISSNYDEAKSLVVLGSFDATKGKSTELLMVVSHCPEEGLKISDVVGDPPELKADISPVESPKSSASAGTRPRRYRLTVSYPAGSPRAQRLPEAPATITLKTNHPEMQQIKLNVSFLAD